VFEDARPGVGEGVPRRMAHEEVVEGARLKQRGAATFRDIYPNFLNI
jgi:hypothetical protein